MTTTFPRTRTFKRAMWCTLSAMRLRTGIGMWLVSWVPFAVIFGAEGAARLAIWGVQIVIGIIGVALAGTAFAAAVRLAGWRHAPGVAWSSFVHGSGDVERPSP